MTAGNGAIPPPRAVPDAGPVQSAAGSLPSELRRAVAEIARTPRLLVACDYDGTLAPIVPDVRFVRPLPQATAALRSLACLPQTTAGVISGRALRELAALSRLPSEVHLIGSHGCEFDVGFVHALPRPVQTLHHALVTTLGRLAGAADGVVLEIKPASVAVHLRQADQVAAGRVLRRIKSGPAAWDGVHVTEGDAVIELSVVRTDKGDALDALRHDYSATATVYIGDDASAEEAFARLSGPDLGIKVGTGTTSAVHRIPGSADVAAVLELLCEERRDWLHGGQAVPIERLSMLGDGRSVALITPDARVCWLCVPGPASGAVFAELLGGPAAGRFSIAPRGGGLPLGQRYVPGTMTLETRWPRLLVTDYLDRNTPPHRTDLIRVITGSNDAIAEFAPRPEFGHVQVRLQPTADGLVVHGTSSPMVLRSPGIRWEVISDGWQETARATLRPEQDRPVVLELRWGTADLSPNPLPEPVRRDLSGSFWAKWLSSLTLPTAAPDLAGRSAVTLRALCHAGTGGIMAAATTSLPEEIGGVRNWDYRHCWLRDAALTAHALVTLGSTGEASAYLDWVRAVLASLPGPEHLRPVYTLDGSELGPEAVIETLPGYAGSRPVRVGNLAEQQVQLDVFGPIVELIAALAAERGHLSEADWNLAEAMCHAVARRWHEPDHGIWEDRQSPRHHVYSKVMCWVTINRSLRMATAHGRRADPAWPGLQDMIAADVIEKGWNEHAQAFTAAYDGSDLDAASLHVGLSGLLSADDRRFHATVAAVEGQLRAGRTVYRYQRDDGLPGKEGGFHLCTAWMIEAYLLTGRRTEAEELFSQFAGTAGPTGLLSEEYDPFAERSLGNHPQAYSHVGLIRCAQLLSGAAQPSASHLSISPETKAPLGT